MKLSQWAKKNGLTYQTAFNLFKKGQLPGKVTQLPSGTILIEDDSIPTDNSILLEVIYIISLLSKHCITSDLSKSKINAIKSILEDSSD